MWRSRRRRSAGPRRRPGWRRGTGLAVYARLAPRLGATSIRLMPLPEGRIRAEVPIPETGTGSHTVIRNLLAAELGSGPGDVEVVHVATAELPRDQGVGGSRVTVAMAEALGQAAKAWRDRADDKPVVVETRPAVAGTPGEQAPGEQAQHRCPRTASRSRR